jgi:sialate O-acetylesterase
VDDYVEAIREWQRTSAAMEAEGKSIPPPPAMPKDPRPSPFRITTIYNGMIAPLAPYALQGVIWYQGESNTIAPEDYRKAFRLLIKDWRRTWKRPDMPFLFVQLANRNVKPRGLITADSWPRLREAQLMTLSVPRTGMAVAIDVGDVVGEEYLIHPRNKQAVGRRLALAAEAIAYRRDVLYSGPIYRSMKVKDGKARLTFDHADGGLVAKDEKGELRSDGPLNTFTIAGADGKFVPAQARIEGKAVVVWADAVEKPKAVRYAFASNPVGCNLYNKAGLPASPFRSDGPASR